jgi:hypothetical protein
MISFVLTGPILSGRPVALRRRALAPERPVAHDVAPMLFVLLLHRAPGATPIMVLTLAVAMYLTVLELREFKPHWKWWGWWLSLVFLIHFPGYLGLRLYRAIDRWRKHRARA